MAQFSFTSADILRGHTSKETAYLVDDYPYGYTLRTSIRYWIETKPNKGDRFCSMTINPKNGRENTPKMDVYYPFQFLYLDEKGHVKNYVLSPRDSDTFKEKFKTLVEMIGLEAVNPIQQQNLRTGHYNNFTVSAAYQIRNYAPEQQPAFREWAKAVQLHIKECPFIELTEYPDPPAIENKAND
jgi:hypothetical protein